MTYKAANLPMFGKTREEAPDLPRRFADYVRDQGSAAHPDSSRDRRQECVALSSPIFAKALERAGSYVFETVEGAHTLHLQPKNATCGRW